jgi:D-alanyl-D-alanine carboxypeptidase/D-alanyl-D-alanine-endopeptidase (penicillin-binding protein 4)
VIDPQVQRWAQSPAVRHDLGEQRAFMLMEARSGAILAAHDADRPVAIASCQKVFTAAAALAATGPERTFTTEVRSSGDNRVHLCGGGDPRLSPTAMAQLAGQVAHGLGPAAGEVQVMVDETLFAPFSPAPGWAPDYLPLEVQPVVPLVLPEYFGDEPGRAVGESFAGALIAHGLPARFCGLDAAPPDAAVLATVDSEPVSSLVSHMLQTSHNLTAEVLHRQVARSMGEDPDWSGAQRACLRVLASLGLAVDGAVVADGSGLSAQGRWPLTALAELLRLLVLSGTPADLSAIFPGGALAQVGLTGSLSAINGWFTGRDFDSIRGRVWAKSGTLAGTLALAGIAHPRTGGPRVFAIVAAGGALAPAAARRRLSEFAQFAAGPPPRVGATTPLG